MATLINNAGVQHYANKMVLAENRKVGSKNLPTALADIDNLIDEMNTSFDAEYGSALDMKLENNENVFSVGTGTNIDKKDDVENSFTDVELSGNSLVNITHPLYPMHIKWTHEGTWKSKFILCADAPNINADSAHKKVMFNPRDKTTYTIVCNVIKNTSSANVALHNAENTICMFKTSMHIKPSDVGILKFVQTADYSGLDMSRKDLVVLRTQSSGVASGEIEIADIMILEGDWSNKPLPQYFQGLKSVGEKEDGNHKISISSMGKNLCPVTEYTIYNVPINQNMNGYRDTIIARNIRVKPNTTYAIYFKDIIGAPSNAALRVMTFRDRIAETGLTHVDCYTNPNRIREYAINRNRFNATITTESDANYINVTTGSFLAESSTITYVDLQIVEGSTVDSIEPYKEDEKEISLNEPLRGLPNGVKDTIEKINGEWKIVRRCGEIIFNGEEDWILSDYNSETTSRYRLYLTTTDIAKKINSIGICDTIPVYLNSYWRQDFEMIENDAIFINIRKKIYNNLNEFKEWLSQNPTKVVYELATPIIEDISPVTLQCWKNGTISIDEVLPVETTHTVALNKPAQIKRNIEELTALRKRVQALEEQYDQIALEQAHQLSLINHSIELDYNI